MNEKGVWNFSLIYDVTFSHGIEGGHSTLYLGEGKQPTAEHLLQLAKKHGIKKADAIIENIKQARDK
jgi:serine/threonine-protein kinase HipA